MKQRNFALVICLIIVTTPLQCQVFDPGLFQNLKIRNIGPANMSGRITAIDVVESNQKIIYVGAASGGVWKSENGGTNWRSIFDSNPTVNIGALAIQQDNPNVVWVGTGEGNPRNSMNLGMGIFKSLDGGNTWKHLGLERTKTIHRIIVHPSQTDIIYVGAMGDPFTPGPDRGLYRTSNGGKTWDKILFSNNQSGVADMIMDPSNPNKIFVALYDHRRTPYSFISGGPGSGLFVTYDGGDSWIQLNSNYGLPEGELGRIGLAIAPSDPNRIYAKVEAKKNALYRSDDGGESWKMINDNPRFTNNRPFYFQELAVDSKDPNRLYNIYQPLSVSYDGGQTFDPTPQIPADETKGIHADFHAFWMSPTDPDFYIIGGDGGIGITRDKGKSWFFPENIPVGQFYHINVDEELPYNVYGGLQDNGNWYGPGYVWRRGGIRTLYWQYLVGGDGFYISPDASNANFGYGTSQNGNLYRYDKTGGYYSSIKPPQPLEMPRLRFNWNAGFAQDPHDLNAVYYGSQFVHKSLDKGSTWEIISPDLTNDNPMKQKRDYGGLTLDASGAEFYNSILAVAPSPLDQNVVWVGTDDGNIQLTKNGGLSWTNLKNNIKGLPEASWIARIHASQYDPGTAWVVANNYRQGDYSPYLFRTTNYGKTWESMISGSIYGYTLSFIQDPIEPNLIFLGTENGLWISMDQGKNWRAFKNGFPSVSTMDLSIQKRESALIVGTFGRSIWILDDLNSLREAAGSRLNQLLTSLPMNDVVQVKGLFINAPGNIWTGFHTTFQGENRPFQKTLIPFFIKDIQSDSLVTINIKNSSGETIQKITAENPPVKGLNYLEWKLDETIERLPGSWVNEESRGIPVLPGTYEVIVSYAGATDATSLSVIPDPRFNLDPSIDQALYKAQKELQEIRKQLVIVLNQIDQNLASVERLHQHLIKVDGNDTLAKHAESMISQLQQLKDQAAGKRPDKQVGAWQSFEVTPFSKIKEAETKFMSGHQLLTKQELKILESAHNIVDDFVAVYEVFNSSKWLPFKEEVEQMKIKWF